MFSFLVNPLYGQDYFQNVKGIIRDQESLQPIPEVTLQFTGSSATYTTFTDLNGNFRRKIPSGRWDLVVSRLGYGSKVLEIQVGTGKEVMLEINLEAKVFETKEVQVSAGKDCG